MNIDINAAFDSGNIELVGIDGDRVDLEIRRDAHSDFYQWFHFRVAGARGRRLVFRILNAGGAAYAFGWPGYRTRVSTDRQHWRMTETRYADGVLEFAHEFDTDIAWFAYFAPYSLERQHDLVSRIAMAPGVAHHTLGQSIEGRSIDCLELGEGPLHVWLYGRQHPGESMAAWWMEGALEKLTDPGDAAAQAIRAKARVHVVPNMNPDGAFRGHLRTNAAGVNLNREWHAPTAERSPEVLAVKTAMEATGVDWAIDVHGDEAIPANFLAGFEGIPRWTDTHGARFYDYGQRLAARTPLFQTERGYEKAKPGQANLSMSTNQLAERFGAVSMTLEMPFKDHDPAPDPVEGWSPDRCKALAHACLDTLAELI
ncbi:M14 family metallopeptidase [Sphingomonas baiyangensis]|uniref:Carboxypeptidase family protein n=1 Tax=Sphingomonas baiyangensis TaxID=2572576 RepID=A0A4U1L817_9SPHN|nr:M14-type cytosolic carboxypeptidase [Sphingomonas baiyangensis]TKD53101.1 carboxypeptidase family protein [Sphingomonas baiyangensis]